MRRGGRPQEEQDDTPGGDSFLDIVANIVGILVLLVVVVGVRAGRQVIMPPPVAIEDTSEMEEETNQILRKLRVEQQEITKMAKQAALSSKEAMLRNAAREDLALYIKKLEQEIEQERSQLTESDRRSYEIGNKLAQARFKLEELTRKQIALTSNTDSDEAEPIYFDPTPIIRERVTEEIMIRLKGDQVVYLPMDELREALSRDIANIRNTISSEAGAEVMIERRVGPVDGFSLRTLFGTKRVTSKQGVMQQTQLVVARLEEQGVLRAETIDSLGDPASRVNAKLASIDPKETVVTLVVYPDSYDSLPKFEQTLRERGYRVAKALQRDERPIEFSPSGRTTQLQ